MFKYNGVTVELLGNTIWADIQGNRYYARYPFNVENTPEHLIDILVWLLFHEHGINGKVSRGGYDVEVPAYILRDETHEPCGDGRILSYSGGADSTAVLSLVPDCTPILIDREYDPAYLASQRKVAEHAGALVVYTDFERARLLLGKANGFNIGFGYVAALVPFLPHLNASEILLGSTLAYVAKYDDVMQIAYGRREARQWLDRGGVTLSEPLYCLSEAVSARIAESFGKPYSSCHGDADNNKCLRCYKCFRKEGVMGRQLDSSAVAYLKRRGYLNPPVYLSAVYAAQKAGYGWPEFDAVDVKFAEKYCEQRLNAYCAPRTSAAIAAKFAELGIEPLTRGDDAAIEAFLASPLQAQRD